MRWYMSEWERNELERERAILEDILNDENSSEEEKQDAALRRACVAGALLSPLFPPGIIRITLMIGFFAVGFLSFLTSYKWLFLSFFLSFSFSPRIVGEMARVVGAFNRGWKE